LYSIAELLGLRHAVTREDKTMHRWGDDWKYWDDLYKSERYITRFFTKATGLHLDIKEKFGTLRYGGVYLPVTIQREMLKNFPNGTRFEITRHLIEWGHTILTKIIQRAAIKYPQCKEEILDDLWWNQ
jgi:hypothetical protein